MSARREPLRVTVGILAGGRSQRMGRDKAGMNFGKTNLLEYVMRNVKDAAAQILVSARSDSLIPAAGAPVVLDEVPERGPVEGVRRILGAAECPVVAILPVDMPFIEARHLTALASMLEETDALQIFSDGVPEPFPFVARTAVLGEVEQAILRKDFKVTAFQKRVRTRKVELTAVFGPDEGVLIARNVNTPEDAKSAILRLGLGSDAPDTKVAASCDDGPS